MPPITRLIAATACVFAAGCAVVLGVRLVAALSEPVLALSVDVSVSAAFFGLLACAGAALSRTPFTARLGLARSRLRAGAIAVLALGLLCTSQALDTAIGHAGGGDAGTLAHIETALAGARGRLLVVAMIGAGILPAIGEELFFRGLLQRWLVPRTGAGAAVLISAAAFGLAHMDPVHGPAALVLGLYLGAVAQLSGGVRAPIACHAANNLVAVLATALWPGAADPPLALVPIGLLTGAGALGLARAIAGRTAACRQTTLEE